MIEAERAIVGNAIDRCRGKGRGEIVVCGRATQQSPYRLPRIAGEEGFDPAGGVDSVSRERHRLLDVGGAGAQQNACTTVGAAGWTGCMVKGWKEGDEQHGFQRREPSR